MKHYSITVTKLQLRFVYQINAAFVGKNKKLTVLLETCVTGNMIDSLIGVGESDRD
jgi:hypothetical protein